MSHLESLLRYLFPSPINSGYYIMLFIFICFLVFFFLCIKDIVKPFVGINRFTWLILILVFLTGMFLRLYITPHLHIIYYDEYEHLNIAQNMMTRHEFCRCDAGNSFKCESCSLPQWGPGYYLPLSMVFKVFGMHEEVAFNFTAVSGGMTILLIFCLAYLITKNEVTGLFSAALLSIFPLHIKFSGSSSPEIISLFFITFSCITLFLYIQEERARILFLNIAVTSYTVYIRPENVILLPLFFLLVILKRPSMKWANISLALIFLFLLVSPYIPNVMFIHQVNPRWGRPQQGLLHGYLLPNLRMWVYGKSIPLSFSLLSAFGIFRFLKKDAISLLWLFIFFTSFFCVYTFYQRVDVSFGDDSRYILQFIIPIIIFASVGFTWLIHQLLTRINNAGIGWSMISIIIMLFYFNILWNIPLIYKPFCPECQEQHRFFLRASRIDNECIIFAPNPPSMISTLHGRSYNIGYLLDEKYLDERFSDDNCLIYLKDVWCYADSKDVCEDIEDRYNLSPLMETIIENKIIGFYRIRHKNLPQRHPG